MVKKSSNSGLRTKRKAGKIVGYSRRCGRSTYNYNSKHQLTSRTIRYR